MTMCSRFLSAALCAVIIFMSLPDAALANSAEPPTLVIIVNGAPKDLVIEVEIDNELERTSKKVAAWETYYAFYYYTGSIPSALRVRTGEENYTIRFDKSDKLGEEFNVTYTLDLATHTLSESTLPFRSAMLVVLRVALTLLIEGAIFFAFGFRKKSSWLLFLIINLVTQGLLNWQLAGDSVFASYRMLPLIALEILVLAVEIPLFTVLVKEHKAGRRALYAVTANIVSFVAGGFMIMMLPV
jgi:hypothetical protein